MTEPVPVPVAEVVDDPTKPWKALAATLAPLLIALVFAFTSGSDGGTSLTGTEVTALVALAAGGGVATYLVPNPKRVKGVAAST